MRLLIIGGPLNGMERVIDGCNTWNFPIWDGKMGVDMSELNVGYETYRVHRSELEWGRNANFTCYSLVHSSLNDHDANRAALGMFLGKCLTDLVMEKRNG